MTTKQEIWEFTKINFKWLIGAVLILVFYFQGCFKRFEPQVPTITRDTVTIVHKYESAPYIPPVINVLPAKPQVINQPQYVPDTSSIEALRKQFNELVIKHTEQNVYKDSILLDSLGYINLRDTVSENKLANRSYDYKINEREITITKTLPPEKKRQLYAGMGIQTSSFTLPTLQQVKLGLIYKDRKDNMIGVAPTYNLPSKQFGAELQVYKVIKLKR